MSNSENETPVRPRITIEQMDDGSWVVDGDATHDEELSVGTRDEALAVVESSAGDAPETGTRFAALLAVEGRETGDGRLLVEGSVTWRDLPVPLMLQTETPAMGGHAGAEFAGWITEIVRVENRIEAAGVLDSGTAGARAAQLLADAADADGNAAGFGVSVDLDEIDVELDVRKVDADGWPIDAVSRFVEARVMGATMTPFPAIDVARVWLAEQTAPPVTRSTPSTDDGPTDAPEVVPVEDDGMPILLAAGGPMLPPVAWYARPELDGPTPLTIDDDGRIYGHIALWGTCHVGRSDVCLTAPASPSDYAHFLLGEVVTAEGDRIPVGTLTMDTGHADLSASAPAAVAHYDDTGRAVADVTVGEDEYGVWVSGAVRPDLTDEALRALRGAKPSGDWRRIGGALELVAVLAVNVPGFPVARIREGAETALVAAAAPSAPAPVDATEGRLAAVEARLAALEAPSRIAALDARIRPDGTPVG